MVSQIDYDYFIKKLDERLQKYFDAFAGSVGCKKGCSLCCEKGDYPLSDIELEYLIKGYIKLNNEIKLKVQQNIKNMEKGGQCPFLVNKECSIYKYRPIVCRVHGLAYVCRDNVVKVPYCANKGLCYKESYANNEFIGKPVLENLDTKSLLKDYSCEIRNLYDWIDKF